MDRAADRAPDDAQIFQTHHQDNHARADYPARFSLHRDSRMKSIPTHRLPNFWSGMSFTAKAAWLCTSRIAENFNEACSMLAHARRRPRAKPSVADYTARMERQKLF